MTMSGTISTTRKVVWPRRSDSPNASSNSPLDANQRYSVGRETPACSATSDRLSFV